MCDAILRSYYRYVGGQFWAGGWWRGGAYTSFFREVCDLQLKDDLWERGKSYEATMETACWWWPHRDFVMVVERPAEIHRELVNPLRPRGWGSHRLHRDDGPAVVWPDGWGVYSIHGVRVPRQVVEEPDTLTIEQIGGEENAEVRRVMIDRFGMDRYVREAGGVLVDEDVDELGQPRKLWRLDLNGDEPIVVVELVNSTAEPDGSFKRYMLRVPPSMDTAWDAVAWTWDMPTGDYELAVQS